jgi:hypothetical protein
MLDPKQFQGWIPIRVEVRPSGPEVDWCYLGERTFEEPFFENTIRARLRDPYYLTSRQRSSVDDLCALAETRPSLPLAGMIFHMSRCGSTLISQVLAASPANLVISEAPPIDEVLESTRHGIGDETRITWLRAIVAALGQPRRGSEQQFFLKLDSWHIHELPLFRQAFPDVPWIFIYREPVEVIVSHQRSRGMQMIPAHIPAARLHLSEAPELPLYDLDLYCARVLGAFCEAGARYAPAHNGLLINYSQIPAALWSTVLPYFGQNPSSEERELLALTLQYHAKYPGNLFQPDADDKRAAATARQVELAEQYVGPAYRQLEQLRLGQGQPLDIDS